MQHTTICLVCDHSSTMSEPFFNLSLDLSEFTSLSFSLSSLAKKELLVDKASYACPNCKTKQHATRSTSLSHSPPFLLFHLKRFEYDPAYGISRKLSYRIPFTLSLRLPRSLSPDRSLYSLIGVVVHVGSSLSHGHYITYVKKFGQWFLYDDELVFLSSEQEVLSTFGDPSDSEHRDAYVLMYERL